MSDTTSSQAGQVIALHDKQVISVTKKTVRYGTEVYQTHNIAGFGEGEINIGSIPWIFLIILFALSPIAGFGNQIFGLLLISASIGGMLWNLVKPKHYGFLITLNSGDKRLFVTTDKRGIKEAALGIYDFIESEEKENTYQMSITANNITGHVINGSGIEVSEASRIHREALETKKRLERKKRLDEL